MSRAVCRYYKFKVVWVRSATSGAAIPCDPEVHVEYIVRLEDATEEQKATGKRVTLVTSAGQTATGILGTVLTKFSREWRGRIAHFASCTPYQDAMKAKRCATP